jgi:pimeloyl-ACP methyl ester carboxylesterase
MGEHLIDVGDARLCWESSGSPDDPAVLLIGGIAMPMDWWAPEFCARLAGAGRFVVRYDHRDTGRSTCYLPGAPGYTFDELSTDPLRVLDALGIGAAHIVGLSMGGGIAQQLGAQHPSRVRTLTLVSTSLAGDRTDTAPLPPPEARLVESFANPAPEPDWQDRAAVVEYLVDQQRLYAGDSFDEERVRGVAQIVVERSTSPASAGNHALADGGSAPPVRLADITAPTLVLHGTADPLFPLPHGHALAAAIAGARLVELPGMGHEVPPPALWDTALPEIVRHTA